MPATLLTMSQRVAVDAGYANSISSVDSATGDSARIVQYVKDATAFIQTKWGDWRFLWGGLYVSTINPSVQSIPAPLGLYRWDENRMFFDGHEVKPIMWHEFTMYSAMNETGYPTQFVIMPDNSINMYPMPDQQYNIQFSWYKEPVELQADNDVPMLPDRFHRTITNYALWLYAMYDDAAELSAKSNAEYEKWLTLLEADQRPDGYPSTQSSGNFINIVAE